MTERVRGLTPANIETLFAADVAGSNPASPASIRPRLLEKDGKLVNGVLEIYREDGSSFKRQIIAGRIVESK